MQEKILITGALGQIGTDLTIRLREIYGHENVIVSDIHKPGYQLEYPHMFETLNVLNRDALHTMVEQLGITQIYHLAAILSAKGEQDPERTWRINMDGLFNVLTVAEKCRIEKVFWPSSIAVFGKETPKMYTPQDSVTDPDTVYGITKLAGERWCSYYNNKHQLDIRSLRFPGLVSYTQEPGGGSTDFAVEVFYNAVRGQVFKCFLNEDSLLPFMYMPDAIEAIIQLMEAPKEKLSIRSAYNVTGVSFTPKALVEEIQKSYPNLKTTYQPDYRQEIVDGWPQTIDDSKAQEDWGWAPKFDLEKMAADMLVRIKKKVEIAFI